MHGDKKLNFMDQYTFTLCLGAHRGTGTWNPNEPTIPLPPSSIHPSIQAVFPVRREVARGGGEIRFAYVNYKICSESKTEKDVCLIICTISSTSCNGGWKFPYIFAGIDLSTGPTGGVMYPWPLVKLEFSSLHSTSTSTREKKSHIFLPFGYSLW